MQTQIAEHTEEIEQRKQEIMDLLGNRASTKAKSNILIQREIKYQQENPCLQEIF